MLNFWRKRLRHLKIPIKTKIVYIKRLKKLTGFYSSEMRNYWVKSRNYRAWFKRLMNNIKLLMIRLLGYNWKNKPEKPDNRKKRTKLISIMDVVIKRNNSLWRLFRSKSLR